MRGDADFAECVVAVRGGLNEHLIRRYPRDERAEQLPSVGWLGLTEAASRFGVTMADVADDIEASTHALVLPVSTPSTGIVIVHNPTRYWLAFAALSPVLSFNDDEARGGAGIVRFVLLLGPLGSGRDRVSLHCDDASHLVEWRPGPASLLSWHAGAWNRSAALQMGDVVSWACSTEAA
jgi:hypothetical protein